MTTRIYNPEKLRRPPNTDGWGNKLVTIFARLTAGRTGKNCAMVSCMPGHFCG